MILINDNFIKVPIFPGEYLKVIFIKTLKILKSD
jgi:hypothetical protein